MKKTLLLSLLLGLSCLGAKSIEIAFQGLVYNLIEESEEDDPFAIEKPYAIVGRQNQSTIKGDIVIPQYVEYDEKMYPVRAIGQLAFLNCTKITSVNLPEGILCLIGECFRGCSGLTSINLPDGITELGSNCFSGCSKLTTITLPSTLRYLDQFVFDGTGIENIIIPDSVIAIGSGCFRNCTKLKSVVLPKSVIKMGSSVFSQCPLIKTAGPKGGGYSLEYEWMECLPENAFNDCGSLEEIILPDSLKEIGAYAFERCYSLPSIAIPKTVSSIGQYAFISCQNISSIIIPKGVSIINQRTFENCLNLSTVELPSSIIVIGNGAFTNCSKLESIRIPYGVRNLASNAFSSCNSLLSIIIPSSVSSYGTGVFYGCAKLKDVWVYYTDPIDSYRWAFSKYEELEIRLHVPEGTKEKYEALYEWELYFSEIIEDNNLSEEQENCFSGSEELGNMVYRDSLDAKYHNKFEFSLQDSVLSISGYYTGNPEYTTKIDFTIIGHDIFLNMVSDLDEMAHGSVMMQPLTLDVAIEGCVEDYYYIYLSGYYGKTAIVDDYTLHETSFKGYGVQGFVREKPPKTDISTGQKDPKEQDDVDVVCRVRGIVGGHYQQQVRSKEGNEIHIEGTYNSQAEGDEDVEATTSLGRLAAGEYRVVLNVTDADDVMPPFSATLTFHVGGTGVEVISYDGDADVIFDLQGNPVNHTAQGLYIVNGKKIIFR